MAMYYVLRSCVLRFLIAFRLGKRADLFPIEMEIIEFIRNIYQVDHMIPPTLNQFRRHYFPDIKILSVFHSLIRSYFIRYLLSRLYAKPNYLQIRCIWLINNIKLSVGTLHEKLNFRWNIPMSEIS